MSIVLRSCHPNLGLFLSSTILNVTKEGFTKLTLGNEVVNKCK